MKTPSKILCALLGAALLLSSCGENPLDWLNGKKEEGSTGSIAGSVTLHNSTWGTPHLPPGTYGGVTVSLEGTNLSTTTASDGTWKIDGVPKGVYNVSFTKEGFGPQKIFSYQFIGSGEAVVPDQPMCAVGNAFVKEFSFTKSGGSTVVRAAPTIEGMTNLYVVFFGKNQNVSHQPGTYVFYSYHDTYVDIGGFFSPGERVYAVAYPVSSCDVSDIIHRKGKDPAEFPEYFEILAQGRSEVVSLIF